MFPAVVLYYGPYSRPSLPFPGVLGSSLLVAVVNVRPSKIVRLADAKRTAASTPNVRSPLSLKHRATTSQLPRSGCSPISKGRLLHGVRGRPLSPKGGLLSATRRATAAPPPHTLIESSSGGVHHCFLTPPCFSFCLVFLIQFLYLVFLACVSTFWLVLRIWSEYCSLTFDVFLVCSSVFCYFSEEVQRRCGGNAHFLCLCIPLFAHFDNVVKILLEKTQNVCCFRQFVRFCFRSSMFAQKRCEASQFRTQVLHCTSTNKYVVFYGHFCLRRWVGLAKVCTVHACAWRSRCHRKSFAHATHAIEFQRSGASVLDEAHVSEPVTRARSHKSRTVGMVGASCTSFHLAAWSAWSRAAGEWCSHVRGRRLGSAKAPFPESSAASALATVSAVVALCSEAQCNAARRRLGQQQRWEPRR